MTNRPSVPPDDHKMQQKGEPALTKRFYGLDFRMVLGPVIPKTLKNVVSAACMVVRMK